MKNAAMVNEKCACGHKAEDHAKNGAGECVDCYSPEAEATACAAFKAATKETQVVVAQVFHVKDIDVADGYSLLFLTSLLSQIAHGTIPVDFPKNYELVADLKIEAGVKDVPFGVLDKAFELTNNIYESWVTITEGAIPGPNTQYGQSGRRSTSVCDVVTVAGVAYICAPMGWQEVVSADQKLVRGAL